MSLTALVCAVLMIKDEAPVIVPTLQSLVRGGITHFLIYDTGSTDGTQCAVKQFFAREKQCTYRLIEEPFVDFSTSRNRALSYAERVYPKIPFVFMPDAEWYLEGTGLVAFCQSQLKHGDPAYGVLLKNKRLGVDFHIPRLLRQSAHVRFEGAVHETINVPYRLCVPAHTFCNRITSQAGDAKSAVRWERDYQLLRAQCAKNPADKRSWFYLGQTCACLQRWTEAYDAHLRRAELGGAPDEELYLTHYRLGLIADKLYEQGAAHEGVVHEGVAQGTRYELAIKHYLDAHRLRPLRAEPFIRLAEHYYKTKQLAVCELFARYACELPYPTTDTSLIDTHDYEVTRHDLYAVSRQFVEQLLAEQEVARCCINGQK